MKDITLTDLAEELLFGVIKNGDDLEKRIAGQWEFRKNKGLADVNQAIKKGLKLGCGKTEREIDCVALYLKDVFKKVRTKGGNK